MQAKCDHAASPMSAFDPLRTLTVCGRGAYDSWPRRKAEANPRDPCRPDRFRFFQKTWPSFRHGHRRRPQEIRPEASSGHSASGFNELSRGSDPTAVPEILDCLLDRILRATLADLFQFPNLMTGPVASPSVEPTPPSAPASSRCREQTGYSAKAASTPLSAPASNPTGDRGIPIPFFRPNEQLGIR